jgi:ADP-ribose pyrophosphatase
MSEIKTLESKVVYENKWMRVKEDRIRRASGAEGIFGVVEKPDFVVIIPISNGCVHLVEQYRYRYGRAIGSCRKAVGSMRLTQIPR